MKKRTPQQIVDQTNELARAFYKIMGFETIKGYRFDQVIISRRRSAWDMACLSQIELTNTDPNDALAELE